MVLKGLEVQGFKSFPDKTALRFDQGITAVVGPNGSGKSNISDAIRWVLGEQSTKSLRGSKMEDVIFSGTEARRGVGFAEVSLLVDNTDRSLDFDNDDVKVTRRYYRSGDSEYLLNNTGVRLKDVQMLFMDTGLGRDGYSIIGQGRIGDIVASRSEDRREIFEEAAGIAKYRYRKNEAERRLKAAEENLDRLRDILNELEERVGPLAEQSEKAKQYLEYAGEKKHLEIGIWLNTIRGSREAVRDLSSKLELARTQYEDAGEAADTLEEEILNQQSQAQRIMVRIDGIRQAAAALEEEAARCDSRVEVLRNDIYHNSENINRIKNEISLSESGGQRFGEEIRRHESEIAAKEQAAAAGERRQTELALRIGELARNSEAASDRMAGISARSTRLIQELSEVRMRAATAESAAAEIGGRIEQLSAGAGSREQQSQKTAAELAECQDDLDEINRRIQTLQNTRKGYELRHRNRAERLREAKDSADKLGLDAEEARRRVRILEELERNMEGFSGTVKAVIRQSERGALRGIHGAVSQLISAGPEYAVAIETALGAATQYIICENEENAKRAITFLKENREGRATFLPMNVIKGSELNEKRLDREPGFVGMADKLVEYDKKYTQITVNLLGRTAVAEDMDRAVEIAKKFDNRFRVVTLDGQVVNAGGSMTGGSSVKNAGLLARRAEIEKQQARVGELTAKAEDAKAAFQQIAAEASASEAEISGVTAELAVANEDRIRLEGEYKRLTELAGSLERLQADYHAEAETLEKRRQESQAAIEAAAREIELFNRQNAEVEAELAAAADDRTGTIQQREALSDEIGEIKLETLAFIKEMEAHRQAIGELQDRRENAAGFCEELERQIAGLTDTNDKIEEQIAEQQAAAAGLRERGAGSDREIREWMEKHAGCETEQTALRQRIREKSDEREKLSRETVRLEERLAAAGRETDEILERLYTEYNLTRTEAEDLGIIIEDIPRANRRLSELRGKIRALGDVNVGAIEEYKEVGRRYEFLRGQVQDIEISREELRKLIAELTGQMCELFIERFKQINHYFGEVFAELFGGGSAKCTLTDESDILGAGIEMDVQPPGKNVRNLDSLSGGEKALVATALLFAILKVTPSPFCVLDEIDAPLDEVNTDRFAAYLRRMCRNTQFIVITHRRGTMEEADILYGVTMQEEGVSKLLSLRASEVEEKLGMSMKINA